MKITPAHATYFMERKGPAWIKKALIPSVSLSNKQKSVDVNDLILSPRRITKDFTVCNTLSILRSVRGRHGEKEMVKKIMEMANVGSCTNSKSREQTCKKWLKKIKTK